MKAFGLPPAHRGTTVEMRALFPFVVPEGPIAGTCFVGLEASGEPFCFDPWECYANGRLTSPNMVVIGQIGRGKSAFVKSFLWRQLSFGRRSWVLDPKGEYAGLATACGVAPLRLGPGLGLRLNPLDVAGSKGGPSVTPTGGQELGTGTRGGASGHALGTDWASGHALGTDAPGGQRVGREASSAGSGAGAHRQRAELLGALLESSLGRPLQPEERAATDVALSAVEGRLAVPTLPAVAAALLSPGRSEARQLGTDVEGLRHDGRQAALELRRLVHGDLAGMFDGETSPGIDMGSPMVVLDLSHLYGSPALGLLMVCALSWMQSSLLSGLSAGRGSRSAATLAGDAEDGLGHGLTGRSAGTRAEEGASRRADGRAGRLADRAEQRAEESPGGLADATAKRLVVLDEAWAVLSHLATARWLHAAFKLSRAFGVANIAVLHRVSDLRAAGQEGSEQQRLAEGLLSDTETRVCFAQAPGEAEAAGELLGLSHTERQLIVQLPRGVALWHVGQDAYLVEHDLSPEERALTDTDTAMRLGERPG
jgi:hypothetical protein